ncbi:MAG: ATP-binding protein, partial [Pseudomonadota bacterium]
LSEVFTPCAMQLEQRGIASTLAIAQDIPNHWQGDAGRLRQVLANLLDNACKFTEQGGITLRVVMAERNEKETSLHFSIQDTGIGIPADKQQLIFAPFNQADSSMTRKYGGTGLGLTICRQLIEMMGGRVWLESEVGRGSTFHFSLSFSHLPQKIDQLPKNLFNQVDRITRHSLQEEPVHISRILVVDDDFVNRVLAEETLKMDGWKVRVAEDGEKALALLDREHFDLVLMDMQMPRMDGYTAMGKIRAKEKHTGGHLPIIALTGFSFAEDRDKCLAAGADAYLSKPFKPTELMAIVRQHLQQGEETPHA